MHSFGGDGTRYLASMPRSRVPCFGEADVDRRMMIYEKNHFERSPASVSQHHTAQLYILEPGCTRPDRAAWREETTGPVSRQSATRHKGISWESQRRRRTSTRPAVDVCFS